MGRAGTVTNSWITRPLSFWGIKPNKFPLSQGNFCTNVPDFLVNLVALICILNPWRNDWVKQRIVFIVLEGIFRLLIGVPLFVHHLRKGLTPREALAAGLDSVMNFLGGWV